MIGIHGVAVTVAVAAVTVAAVAVVAAAVVAVVVAFIVAIVLLTLQELVPAPSSCNVSNCNHN